MIHVDRRVEHEDLERILLQGLSGRDLCHRRAVSRSSHLEILQVIGRILAAGCRRVDRDAGHPVDVAGAEREGQALAAGLPRRGLPAGRGVSVVHVCDVPGLRPRCPRGRGRDLPAVTVQRQVLTERDRGRWQRVYPGRRRSPVSRRRCSRGLALAHGSLLAGPNQDGLTILGGHPDDTLDHRENAQCLPA
ncbi:MAG TPA: hypothetical protein DEV93_16185 [Chloroflexi bacterium]|nr:hypothetical protein [Chloroflexota bacterium]